MFSTYTGQEFDVDIPENWKIEFDSKANLFSLHSIDENAIGALQLSAFISKSNEWNPIDWIEEDKDCNIIRISDYSTVHFIDYELDKGFIIYHWIIGSKNKMIHITYTVDNKDNYQSELQLVKGILDTLKLK
jgi:hypothetical protein